MTAQEAYVKMVEYSSSLDNCCWFVEKCLNGINACSKDREQCKHYQAFLKVKKALKMLEILEEEGEEMNKKVETFLNELRNLNNYKNKLIELEDKLDILFYDLTGVKAVRYDLVKGMSDYQQIELIKLGKIDEYNIQKDKIEKEIIRLKGNISYIESVLDKMDSNIKQVCIEIYCQKKTYRSLSKEQFCSINALHHRINKSILKIL